MKKTITLLTLIILTAITLTGCGLLNKSKCDTRTFEHVITNAGLTTFSDDTSESLASVEEYVAGTNADMTYTVLFYDCTDTTAAENMFNELMRRSEESLGFGNSSNTSINSLNYSMKTYSRDDEYYHITRVDDTVFWGYTDTEGKEVIKAISDAIGY